MLNQNMTYQKIRIRSLGTIIIIGPYRHQTTEFQSRTFLQNMLH